MIQNELFFQTMLICECIVIYVVIIVILCTTSYLHIFFKRIEVMTKTSKTSDSNMGNFFVILTTKRMLERNLMTRAFKSKMKIGLPGYDKQLLKIEAQKA